ncbi:MAG: hypothetical protein ABIN89_13355 [Chitinophagaceae bacterium]
MKWYQSTTSGSSNVPGKKWYEYETNTELILPVTIDIARDRLEKALASEIIISKGFWSSKRRYSGVVEGYNVFVSFTVSSGRHTMKYNIFGQLRVCQKGSALNMAIRDRGFLFPGAILAGLFTYLFVKDGLALALMIGLFFGTFFYIGIYVNNVYAVNKITSLINNIIMDSRPDSRMPV